MEMSEIQAARLLLGGDGRAGQAASRQVGQESASVRYGEVKSVDEGAGTMTVLLDGQSQEITLTDATASTRLKAGDRVKIVKQGQSWVIDLAGGISRALDTEVSKANARMDAHDKAMEQYEKDMAAAKDELAGMDGKIDSAVKEAVSQLETPDGGNHIYAGEAEPTPPKDGFKAGDLWYQTNSGSQITAVKVWNGTQWNDYDLFANSLLVAGSVGSTLIADGAVTTSKITARAVTADQIAANTITGEEIKAASVDVNEIASDDIICKRLTATDGAGYTEMTGSKLEMLGSDSKILFAVWVKNGVCHLDAVNTDMISIDTLSGSTFKITNSGYIFSSMNPGFRVNGVSAVESYPITPGSATESFSKQVNYPMPNLSFAVVYYKCTYANTVSSVKFPITKGEFANVVLKDFVDVDGSMIVGCIENIAVSVDAAMKFTVTRGKPFRFAIKDSGNSINSNPGPQFEIEKVTLCC